MKIDFKTLTTIIFQNKKDWAEVSNDDKESLFFIFNRYMSKHYPKKAQFFNVPNIDKSICMDIWFLSLQSERSVPFWFWPGPTKKKAPVIKDWEVVRDFWKMDMDNIYKLCELFPKDVKAEIKRLQLINKELES